MMPDVLAICSVLGCEETEGSSGCGDCFGSCYLGIKFNTNLDWVSADDLSGSQWEVGF